MALLDDIRRYWDDDAGTYDNSRQHRPTSPVVRAAWSFALARALPPPPARVLDCGAGTGFVSLLAAGLGHHVTALDLAPEMLARLERKAAEARLSLDAVVGPADEPPHGPYDAIVERHMLWTTSDPVGVLSAWRRVAAEGGRLVLIESLWGMVDPIERCRNQVRHALHRLRGLPPEHHASYGAEIRAALPLGDGTHPDRLLAMVEAAGWRSPTIERLRDVEWSERLELSLPERLIGVTPRFVISALAR